MKYCSKCGSQIEDDAIICPNCGRQIEAVKQEESSGLSIAALIFSILGGWLGLILDIIGLCTLKDEKNRKRCKAGLIISICWVVAIVIYVIVVIALAASFVPSYV